MEIAHYISEIRSLLHPSIYPMEVQNRPCDFSLLLTRRKRKIARYAFAVTTWDGRDSGQDFLATRRQLVSHTLRARWMFAEVGLYLVVLCENGDWRERLAEMRVDSTGFHATIVQGVHFINLQTGEWDANHSAWGPVTFGNAEILADLVASVPVYL